MTRTSEQPATRIRADVPRVRRPPWERRLARILVVIDITAIAVTLGVVAAAGASLGTEPLWDGAGSGDDVALAVGIVAVWTLAMAASGAYDPRAIGIGSEEYRRLASGALRGLAVVVLLAFVADVPLAPGPLLVVFGTALVVAGVLRQLVRKRLHRQRAAGRFSRRVLIVGRATSVANLVRHFRRAPFAGYEVIGACTPASAGPLVVDDVEVPVLGDPASVLDVLAECRADTLAVADPTVLPDAELRTLGWSLEGTGVELVVAPAVTEVAGPRISIRPVGGIPLLHVEEPSLSGPARAAKHGFDRAFALVVGILLLPLLGAIALTIRLTSRGPALFRQTRVGQDGTEFRMLKFRTMVDGAEHRLEEVRPLGDPGRVLFKLPDDPRLTPVGRWLRRHSLDELPQLWNVLRGQMSVVGPRPPLPEEVARYATPAHRRLLVRPGLTGLWQVSGRADLSWEDAVRLDVYYVENWSWVLDALILARTVPAVVKGQGAY